MFPFVAKHVRSDGVLTHAERISSNFGFISVMEISVCKIIYLTVGMLFTPVKTRSGLWVIKNRNPKLPHFPNSRVSVQKRKDEARGFPPPRVEPETAQTNS
jgi:hypothetical protein